VATLDHGRHHVAEALEALTKGQALLRAEADPSKIAAILKNAKPRYQGSGATRTVRSV
jgi:hypothetical protein